MKLSLFADYSCRVVMYLSYRTNTLTPVRDIAESYSISHDHLRKIVHLLSTEGIINSVKGKSGGIRLAKAPKDILVGDFLSLVEPSGEFVQCMQEEGNRCLITKPCRLKFALNDALKEFFSHLNQYSFSDLVQNNPQLESLLGDDG